MDLATIRATNPLPLLRDYSDVQLRPSSLRVVSGKHCDWTLEYRCSGWLTIDFFNPDLVKRQVIDGTLFKDQKPVGQMIFEKYRVGPGANDFNFYWAVDSYSQEVHDVGVTFLSGWHVSMLRERNILNFSALWVAPSAAHGYRSHWVEFAECIIRRSNAAVILLHPGSLKHHISNDFEMSEEKMERNVIALRRLYEMKLGARTMPVETRRDQLWMYRCAPGFPAAKGHRRKRLMGRLVAGDHGRPGDGRSNTDVPLSVSTARRNTNPRLDNL